MEGFVHLHLHTEYSLLDGACRIGQVISAAKVLGQTAIAITDHGNMYGAVEFYKEAKRQGIKPIIGCEVYVAPRGRADKLSGLDGENSHLVLLCKNEQGYRNLIAMVSAAWTEGFYNKPRIDHELLTKYHEGIIALSACLAGEVPRALGRGDYDGAVEIARFYKGIFGGDYYIELQDHGMAEQKRILPQLVRIARENGIGLAATNDVHYVKREDSAVQNVLLCIQTNRTVAEGSDMAFDSDNFYLKSEDEMREIFALYPDACDNTVKIAEQCEVEFEFGKTKLPHFELGDGVNHFEYLKNKCFEGLFRRYGQDVPQSYSDRLNYELDTIQKMGYVDYYLIVHDFISYAKSRGIPVGPGRGSGAGSLAAYCIGITGIDPMKYNLLFERFLNPERVSMPDFDIDFCYERRGEVINYVIEKYGADHVAQIVTFGTMAARAAIRDVGRALGIPYSDVDVIAKQVPNGIGVTIDKALASSGELRARYDNDPTVRELIDMSRKLEGMPRHASTHAAGVVITRDPVCSYVPLSTNDGAVVTQFTMTTLEELGLLKIDFLGLRTLTVIHDAEVMIRRSEPDFDIYKAPLDDSRVYEMLSRGETCGVFQYESGGMKSVLERLGPRSLEDLIAVISLYRPGPMESIGKYIENRHHPDKITYKTPLLKNILDVTYGCLVYQEQVMEVFRTLAGYSYGRADIVRRAMSKKKHDVMERERHSFVYGQSEGDFVCDGAVKRGVSEQAANEIFDEMTSFASYAFNKSHAAAYAYVAYQTAYLKCHYVREFMAAQLTAMLDNWAKVAEYIEECRRLHINVLPPHVNYSSLGFTVHGGDIRFGLLAVKSLGRGFINAIIESRRSGGEFRSFYDFLRRMYGRELNRRAVENLIKCGALDDLGANRRQMLQALPTALERIEDDLHRNVSGQIGFFDGGNGMADSGDPPMPVVSELPYKEMLAMEKDVMGIYLSGHPMAEYVELGRRLGAAALYDIFDANGEGKYGDNAHVRLLCTVESLKLKTMRTGASMAFATLEDVSGTLECLIFPDALEKYAMLLREGGVVVMDARVSLREDKPPQVICERVFPPNDVPSRGGGNAPSEREIKGNAGGGVLYVRLQSKDSRIFNRVDNLLAIFDEGNTPFFYYFCDTKKYLKAPRSRFLQLNEPMLSELKRLIGEDNVVIK